MSTLICYTISLITALYQIAWQCVKTDIKVNIIIFFLYLLKTIFFAAFDHISKQFFLYNSLSQIVNTFLNVMKIIYYSDYFQNCNLFGNIFKWLYVRGATYKFGESE